MQQQQQQQPINRMDKQNSQERNPIIWILKSIFQYERSSCVGFEFNFGTTLDEMWRDLVSCN